MGIPKLSPKTPRLTATQILHSHFDFHTAAGLHTNQKETKRTTIITLSFSQNLSNLIKLKQQS